MKSDPSQSSRRSRAIAWVCWTAILASVGVIYFTFFHVPGPDTNHALHRGVGAGVAREALRLASPGGRILLIHRDTSAFANPAIDDQMEGFRQALAQAGRKIALTNLLRVDPLRAASVPPGEFLELLKRTASNDVVASFLGPAALNAQQQAALRGRRAKVVALCSGSLPRLVNLKDLFERGLLDTAILSRPSPAAGAPGAGTPEAWFEAHYQVIGAANAGDLPERPEKRP